MNSSIGIAIAAGLGAAAGIAFVNVRRGEPFWGRNALGYVATIVVAGLAAFLASRIFA